MITYKTLDGKLNCPPRQGMDATHWTAGTRAAKGTIAKPSTRIAADCIRAAKSLVPTGILSIVLLMSRWLYQVTHSFPMSRMRNAAKSKALTS